MESQTDEMRGRLKEEATCEDGVDAGGPGDALLSTAAYRTASASSESTSNAYASPEACLFVANLPIQWTNEELSYKLLTLFSRFGAILSVKTSRDSEGRPFGFIQFKKVADASYAQRKRRSGLLVGGRKIRIEKARCLRKLQIGVLKEDGFVSIKSALDWMRELLKEMAAECDITVVDVGPDEGACENDRLYFIVKLKDHLNADAIYQDIKHRHPTWSIEWLSLVNGMSQGDGQEASSVNGVEERERRPLPLADTASKTPMDEDWRRRHHGSSQEKLDGLTKSLGQMSMNLGKPITTTVTKSTNSFPMDLASSGSPGQGCVSSPGDIPQGYEIFVGRLHPRKITEDMVMERFSKYGEIISIHMVNKNSATTISGSEHRGRSSLPAMPQDAFAFILYEEEEAAKGAIQNENGHLWAGQPIKVSYAVLKPSSSSLRVTPGQTASSVLAGQGRFAGSSVLDAHSGTYHSLSSQRSLSMGPPPPPPPPHHVNYCYTYPTPLPYWHASPISGGRNVYFPLYYPYPYVPMDGHPSMSRLFATGSDTATSASVTQSPSAVAATAAASLSSSTGTTTLADGGGIKASTDDTTAVIDGKRSRVVDGEVTVAAEGNGTLLAKLKAATEA